MTSSVWWAESPLVFAPGMGRGRDPLDDDVTVASGGSSAAKPRQQMEEQRAATRHPYFDGQSGSVLVFPYVPPGVVDPGGMFRALPGQHLR